MVKSRTEALANELLSCVSKIKMTTGAGAVNNQADSLLITSDGGEMSEALVCAETAETLIGEVSALAATVLKTVSSCCVRQLYFSCCAIDQPQGMNVLVTTRLLPEATASLCAATTIGASAPPIPAMISRASAGPLRPATEAPPLIPPAAATAPRR